MKITIITVFVLSLILMFSGCGDKQASAEKKQAEQTNKLLDEASRQVGMPNVRNFQQKKLMKAVYELCDKEDLICYAYIKSDYQGKLMFIGKCIGYGIPFSAQFTSPTKTTESWTNWGLSGPQADPNGLYMPTSSSATWLMMVDPKTQKPRVVYLEPEIVVSPFPLHVVK